MKKEETSSHKENFDDSKNDGSSEKSKGWLQNIFYYFLKLIGSSISRFFSFFCFKISEEDNPFNDPSEIDEFFEHRGGTKFLGIYSEDDITKMIINSPVAKKIGKFFRERIFSRQKIKIAGPI